MTMRQVINEMPEKEYTTIEDIRKEETHGIIGCFGGCFGSEIFISITRDHKISFLVVLDKKYRWIVDQDSCLSVITSHYYQPLENALNYKLNLKETVYRFDNTMEMFSYIADFKRRKNSVAKL